MKSQQPLLIKWQHSHWGVGPCSKYDYLVIGFKTFKSYLGIFIEPLVATLGGMSGILSKYNPHLCYVYETHVQFVRTEQFSSSLNYKFVEIQEARCHSGGIWIISYVENTTITVLDSMHQTITFLIQRKHEV